MYTRRKQKSRKNERNVTNNALQSMCSESFAIFCPTYEGSLFENKTIKHLFTLDFEKILFSKILILRKVGSFLYHFYILYGGKLILNDNLLIFTRKKKQI